MVFQIACRRELQRRHQRREGRDDAKDRGVSAEVLGQQNRGGSQDDLETDCVVEIEPVETEDLLRVGNRKETEGPSVSRISQWFP